ncbi:RNA 3'-terminal phosphate cyclase [Polychaeton citri CBS 116435]|uniref:RNA 3'-terminal phosphate cyclase n=1 Tax=Polychaeton citri CBS 116435 TaxID=1314669 RepID=A0A9P4UUM2_9PEZI|nr:RNA 3'-terminal phosphate cyclase [Polychaeton citri CBS 116435]
MANSNDKLVELDGTTLEGGGQLLRIALCLSALTATPVQIYNIRGKRSSGGGLKPQHLACVNWLARACKAYVEGAEKGSKTLLFVPWSTKDPKTGVLHQDKTLQNMVSPAFTKKRDESGSALFECDMSIGTAGSTGLGLQAILPFILFCSPSQSIPVRLKVSGGTNVSGSPSYEYLSQVLHPTLQSIGIPSIRTHLYRRGWSHGGASIGSFVLDIPPILSRPLPASKFALNIESRDAKPQKVARIEATFIGPSSIHDHLCRVLSSAVLSHFGKAYTLESNKFALKLEDSRHDKRLYLILVATVPSGQASNNISTSHYKLAKDWLYDRKIRTLAFTATEMAERVSNELYQEWHSGAQVDEHMRDQLVIFQALAEGPSKFWAGRDGDGEARQPSLHAQTAEWVAKQMLGVRWDGDGGCEGGVGYCSGGAERNTADQIEELSLGS